MHHFKLKNMNRSAIRHLNISSLCNKFDTLKVLVKNSLDICIISETKLYETFPESKFLMDWLTHHIGWIEMQMEAV